MKHKRWITVPLNKVALEDLKYNRAKPEELFEVELDERDYSALRESRFLEFLYQRTGIFVDDFEDASISSTDQLKGVIEYLKDKSSDMFWETKRRHLLRAFELAYSNETAVFFYL